MGKDGILGRLVGNAAKYSDKQVAETLAMIIEHGVKRGASDIHIEPRDMYVQVRYRINGGLRSVHKLPHAAMDKFMAQLKTMANLNIQENIAPQEGSFSQTAEGHKVDVDVYIMPVFSGEKAVLHITKERGKPQSLEALGFWGQSLTTLQDILARPYGLLPVSGPKHSGVASTLFAMLDSLNNPLINIATVETSIKYRLHGINQTFTNNIMSISDVLKAALKQDPNVIMLSDLPDRESTDLAVHAATTGHLILTGTHSSDSLHAIIRLQSSDGVEPFLLATALRASIGQRLVRTLCANCRERYKPSPIEQKEILNAVGLGAASGMKQLHQLENTAAPAIFGSVKQLGTTPSTIQYLWKASQHGCEECDYSGYNGQTAIVEVLDNNDVLKKALLSREPISVNKLQQELIKSGFVPMAVDGLVKALLGQTSIAEILAAIA
jgi:type IV pilus assembly protein PilB